MILEHDQARNTDDFDEILTPDLIETGGGAFGLYSDGPISPLFELCVTP